MVDRAIPESQNVNRIHNQLDPQVGYLFEEAPLEASNVLLAVAKEQRKNFGDLDQDRQNILAGMDWCIQFGQTKMVADYAVALADFLDARGYWYESKSRLSLAIEASQVLGDNRSQAILRHNLGIISAYQGNYPEARDQYQRCLDLWAEMGNKQGEAAALAQLGSIYLHDGELEKAESQYRRALAYLEEIDDKQGKGAALHSLGVIQAMQGNVMMAVAYFEASLNIKTMLGDNQGKAAALHEIGLMYAQIGRGNRARECYLDALNLWRQAGDERGEAHTLAALGQLVRSSDLSEAENYLKQSLSIARRLQMPLAPEVARLLEADNSSE